MNRRKFFARTFGAVGAALWKPRVFTIPEGYVLKGGGTWTANDPPPPTRAITFKGATYVFDEQRPASTRISYLNPRWPNWKQS